MPNTFRNQTPGALVCWLLNAVNATARVSNPTVTSPTPVDNAKKAVQLAHGIECQEDHAEGTTKLDGDEPALRDQVNQPENDRGAPEEPRLKAEPLLHN
jgi:hypothetical protein